MIPIIDIFAGPGGLGEGFSAYHDKGGRQIFKIALSIEKDEAAHQTLQVRSFFRQFAGKQVPEAYYRFVRGEIAREALFKEYSSEAECADKEAWHAELGVVSDADVDRRIEQALGAEDKWILIGGPPCQAYSLVGRARMVGALGRKKYEEDDRHFLYKQYLRIIKKWAPPVFVMENVKGMLSAKVGGELVIRQILSDLKDLGYIMRPLVQYEDATSAVEVQRQLFEDHDASQFVIQCERHGIPQERHRVILLGLHESVDRTPDTLRNLTGRVSMWNAIGDLPKLRSRLSKVKDSTEGWDASIRKVLAELDSDVDAKVLERMEKEILNLGNHLPTGGNFVKTDAKPAFQSDWFYDSQLGGVPNHETRRHMESDLRRYLFATCFAKTKSRSPKLADFPKALLPDHKNVKGKKPDKNTYFKDRFTVQVSSEPSTTITSHLAKDGHYFIHPDPTQCRTLTVREAARLQTFPDNYFFLGTRTQQYQQVGNAVPPLLARQLAKIVHALLRYSRFSKESCNGSADKGKTKPEHGSHQVAGYRA